MAKSFYTSGIGNQQTLTNSQDEKIPIYNTLADVQTDLSNLKEGQIIVIKNSMIGKVKTINNVKQIMPIINEVTVVDSITDGNMNAVTSNAVYDKIASLDVSSVGGSGKYISAISETDGKISATETTMDTTPTTSSTNAITSGGVKTAIDNEATARGTAITNAINALDVASVGGSGKYISAISEADGKISATETTMDTAPTQNSTKAVTSGGVKTAIDNEATARNTAIINAINALDANTIGTGGDSCYLTSISETNGVIGGTYEKFDQTPTANSRKGVESGGVKTYVDNQISTAITQVLNASY